MGAIVRLKETSAIETDSAMVKRAGAEEAYEKIKNMIRYHQFSPGQKLTYQELAEKLNLSITPVMQALNRLESLNIVTYKKNRGYFVGEISENEIKELYETRLALDVHIAQSVIDRIGKNRKDCTDSIRKAFRSHIESNTAESRRLCILRDAEFHLEIARHSGNNYVCKVLSQIFEMIFLKWKPMYLTEERIKEVTKEHREILKALSEGDRDKYVEFITRHIRGGLGYIISTIRSEEAMLSEV